MRFEELGKKIGSGARADVYQYKDKAVKLFKDSSQKKDVFYEALFHSMVEDTGLIVPEIYEVIEVDNRLAIIMELIEGIPLKDKVFQENHKIRTYIERTVGLQNKIHNKNASGFPNMKDRFKGIITNSTILSNSQKNKLLQSINSFNFGNGLCHGDFHFDNLILSKGRINIIDWIDVTSGSPEADLCRTYMLYCLYAPREWSEMYIQLYCQKTGKKPENILKWLPIVAGVRLSENIEGEKDMLKEWVKIDY